MITPSIALRTRPGRPYPLGATWDGDGVNFALFSQHATSVELCIFDRPYGAGEVARVPVRQSTGLVWHVHLPHARPGAIYGWRVHGPWDPQHGQRFNPNKLLLDPYARATTGPVRWSPSLFGYRRETADDLTFDVRDSAPDMIKAVVLDGSFDWGNDHPPRRPWHETVIYEAHVKGMTRLHPELSPGVRGTYAGLGEPRILRHLRDLGVTAVELMPVHQAVTEPALQERGLPNYWGYSSLAFFAPDPRLAASETPAGAVDEFKTMVKALHAAGIEVILDVVYNHTGEVDEHGPTLSFRGIDNASYYRLPEGRERFYINYTGTGNTLNLLHPFGLQLVTDSLRYWTREMHVDGFRFDLAPALARGAHDFDRLSAFFQVIHQDPVLSQVKLIAEPWDAAEGGYQAGNFPVDWAEWNGVYRDSVRRYWRGDGAHLGDLAYRLTGSSDLYAHNGRRPYASINFVTCHDGFTMNDLVSYDVKHNEANLGDAQGGSNHNFSSNHGVEGPTLDAHILTLRAQQMRNFLTTLAVSQGVPMLLMGDEVMRTQHGNNNAYCQDNEISWMSWQWDDAQRSMLEWTRRVLNLRKEHPVLRRHTFFQGRHGPGTDVFDIVWLGPDGSEMTETAWRQDVHAIGMWLAGTSTELTDEEGAPVHDDTLVVLLNAGDLPIAFHLPPDVDGLQWRLVLDTSRPAEPSIDEHYAGLHPYPLRGRSLAVLRLPADGIAVPRPAEPRPAATPDHP